MATGPEGTPRLARTLTLTQAVLYGLGVTIGAGIYVLVGVAAGHSGMHAPLAFVLAAAAMGFTAAAFAELGTRMPVSASEAAYVDAAFHRRWLSLGVGLLVVATAIVSAATIAAGSAGYIGALVDWPAGWIVVAVVASMGAISCMATRQAVNLAGVMTLIELGGLLLIVGAGVWHSGAGGDAGGGGAMIVRLPELVPALGDAAAWMAVAGTSLIAVFAFIGFEHLVNIAEEMEAPNRTLPRALFLTLGITALIYALVVWVAVTAVPPAELAASPAPLALVFQRLTGSPLATLAIIAIVSTLNGVVVHMIMIGRVLYGMAVQGNLPAPLARLHPLTRTPLLATGIGIAAILTLALAVPLAGLADVAARGTLVIFAIVNLALIRLKLARTAEPPGIFRCPLWVAVCGLVFSLALFAADLLFG